MLNVNVHAHALSIKVESHSNFGSQEEKQAKMKVRSSQKKAAVFETNGTLSDPAEYKRALQLLEDEKWVEVSRLFSRESSDDKRPVLCYLLIKYGLGGSGKRTDAVCCRGVQCRCREGGCCGGCCSGGGPLFTL